MKNRLIFSAVVLVLLATASGWYVLSPGYAMSQLAEAARDGDEQQLKERVDFPRIRESLKSELRAKMAAELASPNTEGFGKLGAAIGMAFVDTMIDGLITPESIGAMVRSGKMQKPGNADSTDNMETSAPEWTIERNGLSGFRATPQGEKVTNPPSLVFERDGVNWKLVEIDMPDQS